MDEPRILTEDETYQLRREHATSTGTKVIALCAHPGCTRAAHWGPHCDQHRQSAGPRLVTAELDNQDIADLQAKVEADAAPLFIVAMNWLARQQMERIGIGLPELADGIDRIRHELHPGGDAA